METTLLRRKDTTKGPPLRILSLDGGGVRGYSMLILLQELMYRTYVECEGKAPRRDQIPKPCDHFDLIAGTGTGGLIAIMLGRLRLDIETCKEVYVRMTRRVFETDKTIAGIPYRSTLFKASKLEDAIRDCVKEHTIFEDEGNDGIVNGGNSSLMSPLSPASAVSGPGFGPQRSMSRASTSTAGGYTPVSARGPIGATRWGNPNAYLYDIRENRTKTAVTAVYKGTPTNGSSALLRSYDSRKEPPAEFNCTIWQAGRATCATGLAFKPIKIGQSIFIDEGAGKYNPAPQILDEAAVNEWPGREVGVFLSIGTGKRPSGTNNRQHEWWEGFVGGGMGDFAEARRRLISKIEGCEDTHQYMLNDYLAKRGVNRDNYYRLNVEVGVGDFGMNEWSRLADISTNTRKYLAKSEVQRINMEAAAKMAKIERARRRHMPYNPTQDFDEYERPLPDVPQPSHPLAFELPGEDLPSASPPQRPGPQYPVNPIHPYLQYSNSQDKFTVLSSDEFPQPADTIPPPRRSGESPPYRRSGDQYRSEDDHNSQHSYSTSPRRSHEDHVRRSPPPLPPKTPLPYPDPRDQRRPSSSPRSHLNANNIKLPYPDTDGPPPMVNMARKPEVSDR